MHVPASRITNGAVHAKISGMSRWVRASIVGCLLVCGPAQTASADCTPRDRRTVGWPRDTVVYYDVGRLPRSLRGAARRAFDEWSAANRKTGSNVVFVEGHGPNRIVVRKGRASRRPATAQFRLTRFRQLSGEATIRIDLDNRKFFDPREDGFERAVTKTLLHEVGHTMGLDDVDGSPCRQAKGRSVMNGLCDANDQRNAQPEVVTRCDLDTLRGIANDRRLRAQQ